MKSFLTIFYILFLVSICNAQPPQLPPGIQLPANIQRAMQRSIRNKVFANDSINIQFDKDYFLIEDSCSSIIRYGHYSFQNRTFWGPFHDLNKFDPQIVLAEGNYTKNGKLDGPFVLRYLNDTIQAKGVFKDGKMQGQWAIFYDNGKPEMTFKGEGNSITIQDVWNEAGKKIINNGNGKYKVDHGSITWEGELVNGSPDGTWKGRLDDDRTGTVFASEVFKDGVFKKGSNSATAYTDASRIMLVSDLLLPINNATQMMISKTACDPSMSRQKLAMPVYRNGSQNFIEEIKRVIQPVFAKVDLKLYGNSAFKINGIIDDKGKIRSLKPGNTVNIDIASTLITALYNLPYLEPALLDGKPAQAGIEFSFTFNTGVYSFTYRFLPPATDGILVR